MGIAVLCKTKGLGWGMSIVMLGELLQRWLTSSDRLRIVWSTQDPGGYKHTRIYMSIDSAPLAKLKPP